MKKRVIVGGKEAGTSRLAQKRYLTPLPRVVDAVHDALDLTAASDTHEEVEFFIIDVESAFWVVPLHARERSYPVVKGWGSYLLLL